MDVNRYFTKTFFRFFFAFIIIIAVAFGVMLLTASQEPAQPQYQIAQPGQ